MEFVPASTALMLRRNGKKRAMKACYNGAYMMKSETFFDAKAQIEGAEAQIHEVEANIAEFIKSGPYELVAKRDHEAGIDTWRYQLREQLPRRVRVIIRHVLINLRAPLDHMAHELAIQYSGSATRQAAFPFGRTRSAFERELPKKTEKMSPAAVKLICDCEPYPTSSDYSGGNDIFTNSIERTNISA
jgi:hypothetical protein